MKIRAHGKPFMSLALVAALAVGCGDSMTTAPMDVPALNLDRTGKGVPFQLSGDAFFMGQDFAPDFGPPEFGKSDFGGRCSVPSDFVIRFSVAGHATHMGDVTALEEHCSLVNFETGRTLSDSDGETTITAANGDELWIRHHKSPGEQDQGQFVGGTGRFTGASGEVGFQTECDRAAGICLLEIEGVLSYDASDRSQ